MKRNHATITMDAVTSEGSVKLLVVDDSADSLVAVGAVCGSCDAEVLTATSGREALRLLLEHDVAAILLDVNMPDMDGFETASLIRLNRRHAYTPIIFLTGYRDDSHLAQGYALRAVDFLFKPISPNVLRSKVSAFVALARGAQILREQSEQIRILNAELERKVEERTAELQIATEEAKAARAAADAANQSKTSFLAQLTHELRTPLNAVIGYAEMLEEDAVAQNLETLLPDIRRVHRAARHASGLINDVLDLSKIEAGKMEVCPERFNVPRLLQEVAGTAGPLVGANGNSLEIVSASETWEMESDPTKLRQCLLNLVSNAAKFTHNGSIRLIATPEHDRAIFRVQDTGAGMNAEQVSRLFRPFTQVHKGQRVGGTGLGLTITQHLCHLLGGQIQVESEPGRGTSVIITLPQSLAA